MVNKDIRIIINSISELQNSLSSMPGIFLSKNILLHKFYIINENISDLELKKIVSKLFKDGHHARAVEEAFKYEDNLVRKLAKPEEKGLTGAKLMYKVFNSTSPLLKINSGSTESEINEQNGYMQILSGCMTGIRNPRAHEHDWEDTEKRALQLLIFADHLVFRIKGSEKIV